MKFVKYEPIKYIPKILVSFDMLSEVWYEPVRSENITNIYIGQIPTKKYKPVRVKYTTKHNQDITRSIYISVNNLTKIHLDKIANYDLNVLNYDGADIYIKTEFISNNNQWTRRRK